MIVYALAVLGCLVWVLPLGYAISLTSERGLGYFGFYQTLLIVGTPVFMIVLFAVLPRFMHPAKLGRISTLAMAIVTSGGSVSAAVCWLAVFGQGV
jgi:hypothetical protein